MRHATLTTGFASAGVQLFLISEGSCASPTIAVGGTQDVPLHCGGDKILRFALLHFAPLRSGRQRDAASSITGQEGSP